jgi:hypothetical protein
MTALTATILPPDDGQDADTMFASGQGFTYDDIILLPGSFELPLLFDIVVHVSGRQ